MAGFCWVGWKIKVVSVVKVVSGYRLPNLLNLLNLPILPLTPLTKKATPGDQKLHFRRDYTTLGKKKRPMGSTSVRPIGLVFVSGSRMPPKINF